MEIKEVRVQVPLAFASSSKVITTSVIATNNTEEVQHNDEPMIHNEPIVEEPQEVALGGLKEKEDQLFRMTMWYTYMKQKQT